MVLDISNSFIEYFLGFHDFAIMSYEDKLKQFNQTDKYITELSFLKKLIFPTYNKVILDYGCGIGTAVKYLELTSTANIIGYDVTKYWVCSSTEIPEKIDCTYFMHSIAHIPNIQEVLQSLPTKKIVVITPNKDWIERKVNNSYVPDPTLYKHYSLGELTKMFNDSGYHVTLEGQFGDFDGLLNERIFLCAKKL